MRTTEAKRLAATRRLLPAALLLAAVGCAAPSTATQNAAGAASPKASATQGAAQAGAQQPQQGASSGSAFLDRLVAATVERTHHEVRYDPTYFRIAYPGGDVPEGVGVCTDEVIRPYRAVGVDLQREVHEDMARNFRLYPKKWGLSRPDTNIDHRRVPNLMVFFSRKGASLPVTDRAADYRPGDVVTWDLGGGLTHIGIVVGTPSAADPARFQIVHNIGAGPKMEDVLFGWKITGHYRYEGPGARPLSRAREE
ncbi:MAG TPA: DUF1287 domain-containing protein [Pyrinomonadaceae bacterium]